MKNTGSFSSGNPLLNKIHGLQRASLLDNMWGLPSDTPWRDRQGWTADAYLYLDSAALNFGVKDFYNDWLRTYRDTQLADGSLPVVVPNAGGFPLFNDPSWSGTIVLDAWGLYQQYGDENVLEDNYVTMTRWVDLMAARSPPPATSTTVSPSATGHPPERRHADRHSSHPRSPTSAPTPTSTTRPGPWPASRGSSITPTTRQPTTRWPRTSRQLSTPSSSTPTPTTTSRSATPSSEGQTPATGRPRTSSRSPTAWYPKATRTPW